jgi:cell division control protein 45
MEVKRKMRDEFDRFLPEYGLTELYLRSFLRVHHYRSKVSAEDIVSSAAELFWNAY